MTDERYWKSPEELEASAGSAESLAAGGDSKAAPLDRREFLLASGFTVAGSLIAGCARRPVEKAIPYLIQPEEIVPGRATWYASTCGGCTARCGLLVKTRDGRPIKLEGIDGHPTSDGGLCAVGQASLLGLYDSQRLAGPRLDGVETGWDEVDRELMARLAGIAAGRGRVRLLTDTITSPTERRWIERFLARFADGRHVVYDPLSSSAILDAHQSTHGVRVLPRYRFDRAEVIVSVDADFLGTWISPVEFTAAYRRGRDLAADTPHLSYHAQLEGRMSLTGTNADRRVVLDPAELGPVLGQLAARVAGHAGDASAAHSGAPAETVSAEVLDDLAHRLWEARGRALVVSGSQSTDDQILVNYLNHLVGGYGATLDVDRPSYQRAGNDRALAELVAEIGRGEVDLLLVRGVNPAYDLASDEFTKSLEGVPLVISFAGAPDETSALAGVICPEPHALEAWGDSEAVAGVVAVSQPSIRPLNDSRPLAATLAAWLEQPEPARELVRQCWREEILPRAATGGLDDAIDFQGFWDRTVSDGYAEVAPVPVTAAPFDLSTVRAARARSRSAGLTLEVYPKVGMLDGRHAHNPWLQELPDPVSKVVWDNYATLAPKAAAELGVGENDVVRIEVPDAPALELPVYVQPGQHEGLVAVALGYGRAGTDRFSSVAPRWVQMRPTVLEGETVGSNAAVWTGLTAGERTYVRDGATLTATGATYNLASTQTYHYLSVPEALAPTDGKDRPIVQETVLPAFLADRSAGAHHAHHFESDLWGEHEFEGHHWAMAVDLSACTGCGGCVVSCQAENNVPVVGKDEVERRREMHWIRIDRYYRGDPAAPDTVHQPMMCAHCDNAPCETVCPVVATLHSSEGLNMQAYNRCVGTRYCANNCPYKVRRFNWFDYAHDDQLQNLVLNPDVTVRERGVMEKCSFCVQRIQEAKSVAKREGRAVADGDVKTACEQSCPAKAIVFGDLNDPESRIAALREDPRHYLVFEELNVKPSVGYLRMVRNRPAAAADAAHADEEVHHG